MPGIQHPTLAEITLDATIPDRIGYSIDPPADAGGFRPTILMGRISDFLATCDEPASLNQITDAVRGNKKWVASARDILAREGFITVTPGPNRAQLHTLKTPSAEGRPPVVTGGSQVVHEPPGSGGEVVPPLQGEPPPNHLDGQNLPSGGSSEEFTASRPEACGECGCHRWQGGHFAGCSRRPA